MERRSRPTKPTAIRRDSLRRQIDTKSLSATQLDILDTLALARANQDESGEGLTRDELFKQVAPGIWGHAAVAAAQAAGLKAREDDELVRLGQRPYFDQCLQRLLDEHAVVESDTLVKLAKVRVRVRGQTGQNAYLPGVAKRQQRRRNLSDQATALLQTGRDRLRDLFPRMSPSQFEELVLSMQTEGYDDTKPIVRDLNSQEIIDGFHRLEAAQAAGVEPKFADRPFKDDLDRIRFSVRSNLIRRHLLKSERDELAARLAGRHLTTREIARLLGPRPPDAAHTAETGAPDAKRRTTKARPDRSGTRFGNSDRARWGSEVRKRQAEQDALAMSEIGLTWVRIGELLYHQYELDKPLSQGTVWTMAKRARAARSDAEAHADEAGQDVQDMLE
jgi:ParB-like chromosome segregation protein Spo0J